MRNKQQQKEYNALYYREHREQERERKRKYRAEHRDLVNALQRASYARRKAERIKKDRENGIWDF